MCVLGEGGLEASVNVGKKPELLVLEQRVKDCSNDHIYDTDCMPFLSALFSLPELPACAYVILNN